MLYGHITDAVSRNTGYFSAPTVAIATNFGQKFAKDLYSACWFSETDRKIVMPMGAMAGVVIRLHRVEVW